MKEGIIKMIDVKENTILEKEYSKCSDIISDVLFYTGYKND